MATTVTSGLEVGRHFAAFEADAVQSQRIVQLARIARAVFLLRRDHLRRQQEVERNGTVSVQHIQLPFYVAQSHFDRCL